MPSPHVPQDFACRDRVDQDRYAAYQRQAFYDATLGVPYHVPADPPPPRSIDWDEVRDRSRVHEVARDWFFD